MTVRYATAQVQKGTLITSISGSGQVSVSNQVDIKSKVSGEVVYVGVKNGQEVKAGTLLVQIDSSSAQKTVRDAEISLESAKLSLEKLKQPADALSLLQAENALLRARESKARAENDLKKAYEDGFNNVANVFLELPTIMSGLQDILYSYSFLTYQQNIDYYADTAKFFGAKATQYRTDADTKYQTARTAYDENFLNYISASRFSSTAVIESLINETYETTRAIAEAVKSTNNLIQLYIDKLTEHNLRHEALTDTHLASLAAYTSKTNSYLLSLLSIKTTIQNSKETITDSDRTIAEKTESLAELKAGPDPLDIQSQELTIKQRENALLDAKQSLADYYIRAPFDGVITKLSVKKGDSVSGGTVIATLITKQYIAEISLNEIDMAKAQTGQKATVTFDAVEGLNITGEVLEVDTLGTVSQGVVTYNVKIGFDTQDERIKPGMSASAAIITEVKQNVLLVPNSAIKTLGETYYVEMPSEEIKLSASGASKGISLKIAPRQQPVQIGLANDTMTEIIDGLKEGDVVITQTITSNFTSNQSQQNKGGGFNPSMIRMMC